VVLAVLIALATAANILFTVHQVQESNRAFCSLLVPASTPRLPRPADPKATPTAYQEWLWQQRYIALSARFGC